jgi:protein translocase SecG subunit
VGLLFLLIFFVISLFIVGLVLLQEGKGGGLTGMSTGMDGVMGAKNPLRRMTAYLFVAFVVMCLAINMYFHNREDASLPSGIAPAATASTEETARQVVPEGSLRPETEAAATTAAGAVEAVESAAENAAENAAEGQ